MIFKNDLFYVLFVFQMFGGLTTPFPGAMTPGSVTPGFTTPSGDLDLIKIGEARKSLVGVKLDQVPQSHKSSLSDLIGDTSNFDFVNREIFFTWALQLGEGLGVAYWS